MTDKSERISAGHVGFSMVRDVISPLVPYLAVSVGLYLFHSAWVFIAGYHMGMVILLLIAKPHISWKELFVSRWRVIPLVTSILGALGGLLLFLFWLLLGIPPDINIYLQSLGLNSTAWPFFIAYFILVNPFLEEYYWRVYLGSESRRFILKDALFAGYHVIVLAGVIAPVWTIIVFIVLCLGGWFWRQANRWNRGAFSSVISHLMGDLSVILVIYFMVV